MAAYTWSTRELPILEAMVAAQEAGEDVATAARSAVPDISEELYKETIASLRHAGYVDAAVQSMGNNQLMVHPQRVLPAGRRAVGQWPCGDAYDAFVAELENRLEATTDPEEKSKVQRFADDIYGMGKAAATALIVESFKRVAGLG